MIRAIFFPVFFATATLLVAAPSDIGLLPQDKTPEVLEASEPNPFGIRVKQGPTTAVVVAESEETRIRGAIDRMALGGMTRGYGVTKILLGPHMVAAGETLPDVIPRQTERIEVIAVSDDKVELGFVEKNGEVGERIILLGVDLKPVVRYRLHNAAPAVSGEGAVPFEGVYKDHGTQIPTD